MMHKVRWTEKKIAQRLALIEPLVYRRRNALPAFRYARLAEPMAAPLTGADVDDSAWPVIEPSTYWGTWVTDFMLRTHFQLPADWDANLPVALYLPLGEAGDFSHPETLAYIDGQPYAAADRHHQEILLPAAWKDSSEHLLALHGWTGLGGWEKGEPGLKLFMRQCALVQIDQPTRDFIAMARVALGIASTLDANSPAKGHLLNALDRAFVILDTREPLGDEFYASVPAAHDALRAGLAKAGPPLDASIVATGHSHIDVAWLWTLGQTRRKAGRTFHNVLRLMEQFPDYHFSQSQAQLYDYVRRDYPELFEAIKKRIAEGRWEIMGGMWVEADCNLSGPESLARQFLLGRSFWRKHFGDVDSPVLWLPDVFGYAWNLPQLIKEAGLDYFFTIKIGWNQYNRLPYDSFWWQGLDGTRVLTHFSTTPEAGGWGVSTYNAKASPQQALGTWTNFQQKELEQLMLMAFGYGDGGGGPDREMLENIREMGSFPATPRMRQESVSHFFRELEATAGDRLPTWNGELYFELHRGTYTTQSRNKRANRKSEFLLHDAEFLATLAAQTSPAFSYPAGTLRQAWELVCLNQFHDIIPGSSIGPVYVESQRQYEQVREIGTAVRGEALASIAGQAGGDIMVVNPASFERRDLAFYPGTVVGGLKHLNGDTVHVQPVEGGTLLDTHGLAPFSVTPLTKTRRTRPPETELTVSPALIENERLRLELNAAGDIVRVYDKLVSREVLPAGAIANQFQAFEDRPINWDAWDVDIFYDDKMWLAEPATSIKVIEAGPLRATLEIKRRILKSEYVQRISLAYNSTHLIFDTTMNWREKHVLLKVAFPVDILSPQATYEIQWGHVERPTHRNTSWDWARFETCAQKWIDLSEGNYGVSLTNDCKYGHDVHDNVMRISLLRGTTTPDPTADQGEHRFTYGMYPHIGTVKWNSISYAYELNDPLIAVKGSGLAATGEQCFIESDCRTVIIETIKRAEDGNGVIVRLYESVRQRRPVVLKTGFPVAAAWRTNLLEEDQSALEVSGNEVHLHVKPFEIATVRIVPA